MVRVLEDDFERHIENVGDLEGHLQGGRIPALFDGNDGLPSDTYALGQFGLGHFAAFKAQAAEGVGDAGWLHHGWNPRRYATILATDPRIADSTNAR